MSFLRRVSPRPADIRGEPRSLQSGFTIIEMMIAMVVLVPVMIAVLSTGDLVGSTVGTNDRNSEVMDHNRMLLERMSELFRPAILSTLAVRATQTDVDEYQARADAELLLDPLATPYVPALGDWIPPPDPSEPRPEIRFRCASGQLSLNAAALTSAREFEFVLESGETANGLDDDGDGLVDEGRLDFVYEGTDFTLARDVEGCTFEVMGNVVEVTLGLARTDQDGRVHRVTFVHRFHPRNS